MQYLGGMRRTNIACSRVTSLGRFRKVVTSEGATVLAVDQISLHGRSKTAGVSGTLSGSIPAARGGVRAKARCRAGGYQSKCSRYKLEGDTSPHCALTYATMRREILRFLFHVSAVWRWRTSEASSGTRVGEGVTTSVRRFI